MQLSTGLDAAGLCVAKHPFDSGRHCHCRFGPECVNALLRRNLPGRMGQELLAHAGRRGRRGNLRATCVSSRRRLPLRARLLFWSSIDRPRVYQRIAAAYHRERHSRSGMLSREPISPKPCDATIDASINPKHNHLLASLPHDQCSDGYRTWNNWTDHWGTYSTRQVAP